MYIEAELVFKSYKPLKLELGMLFINKVLLPVEATELFELEEYPIDEEAFLTKHGFPVEMYIILQINSYTPPIVLASPTEIGWWDDDDSEDFREITIEDINTVISEFDGWLEIYIDNDEDEDSLPDLWTVTRIDEQIGKPLLIENKVILKYITEEEEEISCDNCGSTNIIQNSSGDIMCENCGWDETED